jgi:hypothetical protein
MEEVPMATRSSRWLLLLHLVASVAGSVGTGSLDEDTHGRRGLAG